MTRSARGACAKAARDLRALDDPPDRDEILRRAGRWPFENATMTPTAIAKHWATLGAEARPRETQAMRLIRGGEP
jgi:hypothetical protein